MDNRGEEQSTDVTCAAPLPGWDDGAAPPPGRAIAVAGEALVDFVLEPDGVTTRLGGGSFNTARTLGRLGLRPFYIGRLSRDRYGRALRLGLEESGVRLDGIVTTDDPTTFALVEVDGNGVANYRFYLDGTSTAGLLPAEADAAMPPGIAALHVGGLGLAMEPHASAIASLVRHAAPDTLILVDPNCRPEAARSPTAYRERLRQVIRCAHVVKASEEDLAYLDPDRTPLETARRLLEDGLALVLLTRGSRGASALTGRGEAEVPARKVEVVDTIGAGDAFGGAWLGAWVAEGLGRDDLRDFEAILRAADVAALVAARTCERAGAEPPRAAKVDAEWCFAW
jgi:fructokinase